MPKTRYVALNNIFQRQLAVPCIRKAMQVTKQHSTRRFLQLPPTARHTETKRGRREKKSTRYNTRSHYFANDTTTLSVKLRRSQVLHCYNRGYFCFCRISAQQERGLDSICSSVGRNPGVFNYHYHHQSCTRKQEAQDI